MVEWIKIGGTEMPFSFNYTAVKYVLTHTKSKSLVDVLQAMEYYDMMLFVALKEGAKNEKQSFKLTVKDCEEFLNKDFSLIGELATKIQSCMLTKTDELENKNVEETVEKKAA